MRNLPTDDEVAKAFEEQYSNVKILFRGGQGVVYRATSLSTGGDVALKVYDANQVEERNDREVEALRKLTGRWIVQLRDAGPVEIAGGNYRFLATTFVNGEPLAERIARGPLAVTEAMKVAVDVALALDELWALRIVHRDVKPPNILVQPDGYAVLIDLGVARHLDQKTITDAGFTFGTEGYFAPEHRSGGRVTCKADVFSLGIVIQEMLLGRHPTNRNQKLLMDGGPRTGNFLPSVPDGLRAIVDSMIAREPIDRPMPMRAARAMAEFI